MESCREFFEASADLVATSYGVVALDGRDRKAVLSAEPKSYRRFRSVWTDVRASLGAIVPEEGQPAENVRFVFRAIPRGK